MTNSIARALSAPSIADLDDEARMILERDKVERAYHLTPARDARAHNGRALGRANAERARVRHDAAVLSLIAFGMRGIKEAA
jgi:hypothetical protein